MRRSSEFALSEGKSERLVNICMKTGVDIYLSGPAARDYLDEDLFLRAGVEVQWMDYSGNPEHMQLHGEFKHSVTILDLIFNTGDEAQGRGPGICRYQKRHTEY